MNPEFDPDTLDDSDFTVTDPPQPEAPGAPWPIALGVLALIGALWAMVRVVPEIGTPGWDETGHGYAGLRMVEALKQLDWGTFWKEFHRPDFYTPVGRLGMGLGFLSDLEYSAPRYATCGAWVLTLALTGMLARRLVGPAQRPAAFLWAVLAGVTCSLGIDYSRTAFLEAWSALFVVLSALAYLRARDSRRPWLALLCGVLLGMGMLVKTTYGPLIIGAVGLTGIVDLFRRPFGVRPWMLTAWIAAGMLAVLAWWFVLPLPLGLETGTLHRETFAEYLTKAAVLSSTKPHYLAVAWGLMSCLSLIVFVLQLLALPWGLARWKQAPVLLCVSLAIVGPLAYAIYPFRIDRFLMPTFPATWALFGAMLAGIGACLRPGMRILGSLALMGLVWFTRGMGGVALAQFGWQSFDWPPEQVAAAEKTIASYGRPYDLRPGRAVGPEGNQQILDFASRWLPPGVPYLWFGGTRTELPYYLVDWQLYRDHGDRRCLALEHEDLAWGWHDPRQANPSWDVAEFRSWSAGYERVITLDPPDPLNPDRATPWDVEHVEWMKTHPVFELAEQRDVVLGGERHHVLRLYVKPRPR